MTINFGLTGKYRLQYKSMGSILPKTLGRTKNMDLVRSFAFSPNDVYIASCSYDGNNSLGLQQNAIEELLTSNCSKKKLTRGVKKELAKDRTVHKGQLSLSPIKNELMN